MSLTDTLQSLARLRKQESEQYERIAQAKAALEQTEEYQRLLEYGNDMQIIQDSLDEMTTTARRQAVESFATTGSKNPCPGISIRIYKKPRYEKDEVMAWCRKFAPIFIVEQLDTKRFEKSVESLDGAPVVIELDPRPTIATDLSNYLQEEA